MPKKKNRSQFRLSNHLPLFIKVQFRYTLLEVVHQRNVMVHKKVHADKVEFGKLSLVRRPTNQGGVSSDIDKIRPIFRNTKEVAGLD